MANSQETHVLRQRHSSKSRKRYSVKEKISLVESIKKKVLYDGVSVRKSCEEVEIHHKQYYQWKRELESLKKMSNKHLKSNFLGRKPVLESTHEKELKDFIFGLREQGMGVTTKMVVIKACSISRLFRENSKDAQYSQVRRFLKRNAFVSRIATHESQKDPRETCAEALDFVHTQRPKLIGPCRDEDFILNMDQTPIPFTFNSQRTLEVVGRRTVNVRKSTSDTKRATFAMTVSASGKVLKPMLIFKGKRGGRIQSREFPTFPPDIVYGCQDNAWMDEKAMLEWVDTILTPYVETAPDHIIPLLLLDSYRCHMIATVVSKIQDLGVEVVHIPGGCTGLTQPVDVGVNKPFKCRVRDEWERWMLEEGIVNGVTKAPTREKIARWCIAAMDALPTQIVKNSWRHGDYSWFPNETIVNV